MQKLRLFALCILLTSGVCFSQSMGDTSSQDTQSQGQSVDCSDPTQAGSSACSGGQSQRPSSQGRDYPTERTPQLRTPPGLNTGQNQRTNPLNPSQVALPGNGPPHPETEFEQMVADR